MEAFEKQRFFLIIAVVLTACCKIVSTCGDFISVVEKNKLKDFQTQCLSCTRVTTTLMCALIKFLKLPVSHRGNHHAVAWQPPEAKDGLGSVIFFFIIFYCIGVLTKQGQHNRFSCSTNIPALKKAELDRCVAAEGMNIEKICNYYESFAN